jgi:hypothetical protein
VNSLNKYLNFDYRSFILSLIRSGKYRLETFDDSDVPVPIIFTTFYIDGDALNEINMVDGQVLAEINQEKVAQHLKEVEIQTGSINIFIKHIQAAAFVLFSIAPWLYHPFDHLSLKVGISGFIALIVYLARKSIPKLIIRIAGKFF